MDPDLLPRHQSLRELEELLSKVKVLLARREGRAEESERLAHDGVGERELVLNVGSVVLGVQEVGYDAAFGRDGFAADSGRVAFGDAVEGFGEGVVGVLADLKTVNSGRDQKRSGCLPSWPRQGLYSRKLSRRQEISQGRSCEESMWR